MERKVGCDRSDRLPTGSPLGSRAIHRGRGGFCHRQTRPIRTRSKEQHTLCELLQVSVELMLVQKFLVGVVE